MTKYGDTKSVMSGYLCVMIMCSSVNMFMPPFYVSLFADLPVLGGVLGGVPAEALELPHQSMPIALSSYDYLFINLLSQLYFYCSCSLQDYYSYLQQNEYTHYMKVVMIVVCTVVM